MKKSTSEHFRYITPVNTVINTFMLSIIGFFLIQQYYRLDRMEIKQTEQAQDIYQIKGYLKLSEFNIKKMNSKSKTYKDFSEINNESSMNLTMTDVDSVIKREEAF